MNDEEMNRFMDLLLEHGWRIQNTTGSDIFHVSGSEMVWELTNEDLYTTNILTFFIIGDLGQPSTKIKDIIHVADKNNNQLIFTKNNIIDQINFIENL